MTIMYLYSVLVFIALTALLTYLGKRSRARSWRGAVTAIDHRTSYRDDQPREEVFIRYRTDAGKTGKLRLDPWNFNRHYAQLAVGDTLVKASGEYMPKWERPAAKP